ncbi:MAG: right-handed parallel beta-helix repeat-containing protein, partial [Bacteroidales bacterium]|nr:right-handed parallel beta-helix repeat-containing protein [Bacteroidales bacterium]
GGEVIINGNLIVNENVFLNLYNEQTYIDINGVLELGTNATFTFSGNGYIKFSKPGPDSAPDNIFAGTNASFVLEGTGKNDKKMEIQQSSVHFPELAELRFENCKIEMGSSARMQTGSTSSITFENVKITSTTGVYNAHRSFHFYGQPNVTINNCIFENGYHGLYGNLTYGGSPLYISNSTFQNNARGIYIYNKGLNLNNCTVKNNTDYVF